MTYSTATITLDNRRPDPVLIRKQYQITSFMSDCMEFGTDSIKSSFANLNHDINATCLHGKNALMYACSNRFADLNSIKFLIDQGADPHAVDNDGHNALYHLCLNQVGDCFESIQYFFELGLHKNMPEHYISFFLMLEVQHPYVQPDKIQFFLDHGADINFSDDKGKSILIYALHNYWIDFSSIRFLIDNGAKVDKSDPQIMRFALANETLTFSDLEYLLNLGLSIAEPDLPLALVRSCDKKQPELAMVKYLLSLGVDINAIDTEGQSVLTSASQNRNCPHEIIEYLLVNGANVNITDINGHTPLIFACENGQTEAIKILVKHGADHNTTYIKGINTFLMACSSADLETVKTLVETGADLKGVSDDNVNVLMFAAKNKNLDVLEYILSLGFDINAMDNNQETALTHACKRYYPLSNLKFLLANGADLYLHDQHAWLMFKNSCNIESLDTIEYLVELGVDLNMRSADNMTPLIYACQFPYMHMIVEYIVNQGVDVNVVNDSGSSALHYASSRNHPTCTIQVLIEAGADPMLKNADGQNLFDLCKDKGKVDALEYLKGQTV